MKVGSNVEVIQRVIVGKVLERRINRKSDSLEFLVAWEEDGQKVERWFDENMIKEHKDENVR